jgi:hypothetical protein
MTAKMKDHQSMVQGIDTKLSRVGKNLMMNVEDTKALIGTVLFVCSLSLPVGMSRRHLKSLS